MSRLIGIVNVTRDSFSDGGRYLDPADAVAHGLRLLEDGADFIEIGAESTHPDSQDVTADVEIKRLTPVIGPLLAAGARLIVDTRRAKVMREVLRLGVFAINDVTALRDPLAVEVIAETGATVVLMHARSSDGRARRETNARDAERILDEIAGFFDQRLSTLEAAGISRKQIILDPGMGFFLSPIAEVSLVVLRELSRLRRFGAPLLISVSRKSFIGELLTRDGAIPPPLQRDAGTLAAELWAASRGADYIRTHEVAPLRDALRVWKSLEGRPPAPQS